MIQIPKLLQSLIALSRFKVGSPIDLDVDRQGLQVRHWSRWCLIQIQDCGDVKMQTELVNVGYGRMMTTTFSTTGGVGEEQDKEIYYGLFYIFRFLRELHEGRNEQQPSFQTLPLLARMSLEQIEEEGVNEEIEAQIKSKRSSAIEFWAKEAKALILNRFIHRR
ncbi:MAG: hypothetical protein EZS28_010602 [Streblomastix strix]|uniref:Uncharacterized protein n=1 Tax=Streblomastix strix TaxID=222440 RepID=A0A5J4WG53_9EUKA|nr:MAG: hypothetical protein EZS28_010602 [Streblomastix strix]